MVMIMNIDTRHPAFRRNLFICRVFDHAGGSQEFISDFVEIMRKSGFNDDEIKDYTKYFKDKGYIKTLGKEKGNMMPVLPSLTAYGIDYVSSINCKKAGELDKELHNVDLDVDLETG
jgi:hypothetical protein